MSLFFSNLKNLLSFKYWFNLTPEPFLSFTLNALYIFFGALLILGLAARVVAGRMKQNAVLKKSYEKFYHLLATMGVFGLILLFFRQQQVVFLSAPFWLIIWLIVLLVWLAFVLRYVLVKAPKLREQMALKNELKKYLP
jgi:hypothetical protein